MAISELIQICSFPLWINDGNFVEIYESAEDIPEALKCSAVAYITVDGEGVLTAEI